MGYSLYVVCCRTTVQSINVDTKPLPSLAAAFVLSLNHTFPVVCSWQLLKTLCAFGSFHRIISYVFPGAFHGIRINHGSWPAFQTSTYNDLPLHTRQPTVMGQINLLHTAYHPDHICFLRDFTLHQRTRLPSQSGRPPHWGGSSRSLSYLKTSTLFVIGAPWCYF